ncbi:hypothetical protein [Planococcus lenghuensis]|uniref:Uncharacterized protein n=1 Tax=Planococcus lenghuensis TaxID=2213202 RepID=A0A1Q2KVI1_9BACL|nr:hypothetical protein [Planococcus lenghuensis]AQQ52199.1 hypothetical protein B0X71_03105 [Planococcus lenghuensis]
MKRIGALLLVLPVHLVMGGISLLLLAVSFNGSLELVSLTAFFINFIGFVALSMMLLKNREWKNVLFSVGVFLGIGLALAAVFLTTGRFDEAFFIYHAAGHMSLLWIMEQPGLWQAAAYSIIPSALIVTGVYLGKKISSKVAFIRTALYSGATIAAILIVLMSSFEGERIETQAELARAFPMATGFPFDFAELRHPKIDPPLPWTYSGISCCSMTIISWSKFGLSAAVLSVGMLVAIEVVYWAYRRFNTGK